MPQDMRFISGIRRFISCAYLSKKRKKTPSVEIRLALKRQQEMLDEQERSLTGMS
jgi:phage-related protein